MSQSQPVSEEKFAQFLNELFEYDEHARCVQSLADETLGATASVSLAVHAIGQGLAHALGLSLEDDVKLVDRLLSNQCIEVDRYFEYWVPYVIGERDSIHVVMDWTSFDGDGHETLALSLLTGRGRSMPLLWKTARKQDLKRKKGSSSQHSAAEHALLSRLHDVIPSGKHVTIVADRKSADFALLELLEGQLRFGYVTRIPGSHYVTSASGERHKGKDWVGKAGRAKTLRKVQVTASHLYPVATVVCLLDKATKEPWCVLASDPKASAKQLARYYGQRWDIEACFREIEEVRFSFGMSEVCISNPAHRDQMLLISALAMPLLTVIGGIGETLGYDRLLKANTVKHRTLSLFRQGFSLYNRIPQLSQKYLEPLVRAFAAQLTQHGELAMVFSPPSERGDA